MATRGDLHVLWRMLPRGESASLAWYVLLSVGSALTGSFSAVLLVPLVQPGGASLGTHVEAQAAWFATAGVAFAIMRWLASRIGARQVSRLGDHLRTQVHAHLLAAPLPELAHRSSAEIANVLTYNGETLVQGFSALQQLAVAAITSLVSIAFAFWISPPLMLVIPVLLALIVVTSRLTGREQDRVSRRYLADITGLFWHSEDFPRRLRHVRSFGQESAERASYGAVSSRLGEGYRRQLDLVASSRLVLELVAAIGIPALFVLAHRSHGVDAASLVAIGLLLGRLLPYLVSTRQAFQQLRSATPAFELWQRYMALHTEVGQASPSVTPPPGPLFIRRLRIRPPRDGLLLEDLYLVPGELTLVSGDSGIGKSSLVDVLSGMAPAEVFEAEHDGRRIDLADYRARVARGAYVCQSVRPWQRTVRECLAWAAPDATESAMHEVVAEVGLASRLSARGLDTALDDASSRLSGGELQRLLAAQVILRRPSLAILDEATSALDAASEMAVLRALRKRLSGTILLVVSHRPAVAALADQVVNLDLARATVRRCVPEEADSVASQGAA